MMPAPFQGDRLMLDFSNENMYSEHMAKLVAWHRYYTRFWKQSTLLCDWRWPDFVNVYAPGKEGSTGLAEPRFLRAVTGLDLTFERGIKLGRKIWNLDHAIWTLQGRHCKMVTFADYIYDVPLETDWGPKCMMPGCEDGQWDYFDYARRQLDRTGVEEFKTRFYLIMGWDPDTGYPTRSTLNELELHDVADALEKQQKLGKERHEHDV
jgi:aldehyde:ferredoxin oxidoreductase